MMKKNFLVIFIGVILISACSRSNQVLSSENEPTATHSPIPATASATEKPFTPTFTPTPTLSLPVSFLTPVPSSNTSINAKNVKSLQEIARYYGSIDYVAKVTKDRKFLFIRDVEGVGIYDYQSMNPVSHIDIPVQSGDGLDLQISTDTNWAIVDNQWLLDMSNGHDLKLRDLTSEINLTIGKASFLLSPEGSFVAVSEYNCPNICVWGMQFVSLSDQRIIYVWDGIDREKLHGFSPTFSPDGSYIAAENREMYVDNAGNGHITSGSVGIWRTSNFEKVGTIEIDAPYSVTDIAFSEDNSLIAIAKVNSIGIYDTRSGDSKINIDDLCGSYRRKVMFALSSPLRLLENSDCSSRSWTIKGDAANHHSFKAPDLSKIFFDEEGNFKTIPYTYPIIPELKPYRQSYYFKFLNNETISYKHFDAHTLDRYSCDLTLANGSFHCQSHTPQISNEQVTGKDRILANDGKYYSYEVMNNRVDIYSANDPSQTYFSVPFKNYGFSLRALDPTNNLIFYEIALNTSINKVVIQDMENNRIIAKWEGETFLSSIAFSENNKYAALCRSIGYNNRPNKDKLIIFDLSEKRILSEETFTCSGVSMAFTGDGSKLAIEHYYLRSPSDTRYSSRVVIFDTHPPRNEKYFDMELSSHAIAFSPDNSLLAFACGERNICFLDPTDGREVHKLRTYPRISELAFSKDGNLLAASSRLGLISLWALPPFVKNQNQAQSSSLSSYNPSLSWNFNQDSNLEGWEAQNQLDLLQVSGGNLITRSTGSDPFMISPMIEAEAITVTKIEIRMKVSDSSIAQIYFKTVSDGNFDESRVLEFPITADGQFHTYTVDTSKLESWNSVITQLRLDPTITQAEIEIDYIHLLP